MCKVASPNAVTFEDVKLTVDQLDRGNISVLSAVAGLPDCSDSSKALVLRKLKTFDADEMRCYQQVRRVLAGRFCRVDCANHDACRAILRRCHMGNNLSKGWLVTCMPFRRQAAKAFAGRMPGVRACRKEPAEVRAFLKLVRGRACGGAPPSADAALVPQTGTRPAGGSCALLCSLGSAGLRWAPLGSAPPLLLLSPFPPPPTVTCT